MDLALIWTERALADLERLVRYYIESEQSPDAASKVGSEIIARIEILKAFPDIGPRYPKKSGTHREIICFDYRIFYRVDRKAKKIYIARIWHGSQDVESLLL